MSVQPTVETGDVPPPLVVIGGSAGAYGPLIEFISELRQGFPAAVLVTIHVGDRSRGKLPAILARHSRLPVLAGRDGALLRAGEIHVAPAGRHLLVARERMRLWEGPRVNRHRPAIDMLFASAAQWIGPRTVAIVLSGVLDDGAVGAALVERVGGVVLAQDPRAAAFASMPAAALRAAPGSRAVSGPDLARETLDALTTISEPDLRSDPTDQRLDQGVIEPMTHDDEEQMGDGDDLSYLEPEESRLVRLACPECGGAMAQVDLPSISYFRCHLGHQFAPESLAAAQEEAVERRLWSAVAALEEQAALARHLAGTTRDVGPGGVVRSPEQLAERARQLRDQVHRWTSELRQQQEPPPD